MARLPASRREYVVGVQIVPAPLWGKNIRALATQAQWRSLRNEVLKRQGMACATCGVEPVKASQLKAHEEWRYDETTSPATASLVNVSLVCFHCHHIEHFGVLGRLVDEGQLTTRAIDDTIAHFCRLNGASVRDFKAHERKAKLEWARRSALDWRIDYGPFHGWAVAAFSRDPLNDAEWPEDLRAKYGQNGPTDIEWVVHKLQIARRPQIAA